jgi:hypothetical protein
MRGFFIKAKKSTGRIWRYLPVYLLVLIFPVLAFGGGPYKMSWFTIDGGGGTSSGGAFGLTGTIGQPDSAKSSSGGYELNGGFQPGNFLDRDFIEIPQDQWYLVGKPQCWKYSRQCLGDADGKYQGKERYWVSTDDLEILIAAWNKPLEKLTGDQICADFDHLPQGKHNYRVSTDDLDILISNWQIPKGPPPRCQ